MKELVGQKVLCTAYKRGRLVEPVPAMVLAVVNSGRSSVATYTLPDGSRHSVEIVNALVRIQRGDGYVYKIISGSARQLREAMAANDSKPMLCIHSINISNCDDRAKAKIALYEAVQTLRSLADEVEALI